MKISFVIPCYNTTEVVSKILDEIEFEMERQTGYNYEVILVNDASPNPNTLTLLRRIVDKRKNVMMVDLAKNSGQPNAILAGCRYASGDYIMTSDDDGQTQLDMLNMFIEKMDEGYDVVCAKYTTRAQSSVFRRVGSYINKKMSSMLIDKPKDIYMSTIFLAKRFVIDEMIKYDQPYAYLSGLILRVTQNVGNVEIEQRARRQGKSGYTLKKLIGLWLNGFTAFSIKPLRLAVLIGFTFSVFGFLLATITIIRKLVLVNISVGWSSLISVILIASGLNLLVLGLVGEYIGRIYMCINKTPQYVVKEVYRSSETNKKDDKKCIREGVAEK